jgi:hypothetical protein
LEAIRPLLRGQLLSVSKSLNTTLIVTLLLISSRFSLAQVKSSNKIAIDANTNMQGTRHLLWSRRPIQLQHVRSNPTDPINLSYATIPAGPTVRYARSPLSHVTAKRAS